MVLEPRTIPRTKAKPSAKRRPGFGRKGNAAQDVATRIAHFGQDMPGTMKFLKKVLQKLSVKFPGVKQYLREEPEVDSVVVRNLGALRQASVDKGFQSVAIADLDAMISFQRTWNRKFLARHGYKIGKRAWQTLAGPAFQEADTTIHRREREARQRGGRPALEGAEALATRPVTSTSLFQLCPSS